MASELDAIPVSADKLLLDYVELYLQDVGDKQSRIRALRVIIGEASGALPRVHYQIVKVNRAFRKKIEDYVVYGIETGSFRSDLEPAEAAVIIIGLLRGVIMQSLAEPRKLAIKSMIKPVQAAVLSICL